MPRVLIGEFGSVVRLGLKEMLIEEGLEVVAEPTVTEDTLDRVIESLPDVVVVDLETSAELAHRLAEDYPAVKVIACSSAEPTMRVFPRFHQGESYTAELSPQAFITAVSQPS